MLSVKIEFCPLDWYSCNPTSIVLYKRVYICKMLPSNCQKLKKKCDLYEISYASPVVLILTSAKDVIRFAKPILVKIHVA